MANPGAPGKWLLKLCMCVCAFIVSKYNYRLIMLTLADIAAYPESINVLSDITNDVRTPDKLIDGVNDTVDGQHMWLAPILPNIVR